MTIGNTMRKNLPKILKITFVSIFIVQMICLIFILSIPSEGQALTFNPQLELGDIKKDGGYEIDAGSTVMISNYIRAIYKYAIGIVGIVATVVMMFGGVLWIVAGGNASKVGEAKAWITAALTGLLLALSSYMILYTVNPALISPNIDTLEEGTIATARGCCTPEGGGDCTSKTKSECTGDFTFNENQTCDSNTKKCVSSIDEQKENELGCCLYQPVSSKYTSWQKCDDDIIETDCKNKTANETYTSWEGSNYKCADNGKYKKCEQK